jgi:hypothetical protein
MQRIGSRLQLAIALFALLSGVFAAGGAAALGSAYSVGTTSGAPNIGKVASGSVDTTFTVTASGGAVGVGTTGSGAGSLVPKGATRTALTTITISCNTGTACSNDTTITVTAGAGSGAGRQISGLSAAFAAVGTSGAAVYKSGSTSGGTSMTFVIKGVGAGKSGFFYLGFNWPIAAGGAGSAGASYTVTATGTGVTTGTGSTSAQASVDAPLTVTKQQDLNFGKIVVEANLAGSISWAASGQGSMSPPYWTTSNARQVAGGGGSIGKFKVTGAPSQQITVTLSPNPLSISGGNHPLSVNFSNTATGLQLIGTDGTLTFYVGGAFSWTASTVPSPAVYQGTMTVTVNYN